jgi:hypothetical protein
MMQWEKRNARIKKERQQALNTPAFQGWSRPKNQLIVSALVIFLAIAASSRVKRVVSSEEPITIDSDYMTCKGKSIPGLRAKGTYRTYNSTQTPFYEVQPSGSPASEAPWSNSIYVLPNMVDEHESQVLMESTQDWKKQCAAAATGYRGASTCYTSEGGDDVDFKFHKPSVADMGPLAQIISTNVIHRLREFLLEQTPKLPEQFLTGSKPVHTFEIQPLEQDPSINHYTRGGAFGWHRDGTHAT